MITFDVVSRGLGMGLKSLKYIVGVASLWLAATLPAWAQTYDTTQTGVINAATTCTAGNFLDRVINVPDVFIVDDLNVGILITHTWRGDVPITLIAPDGTTETLVAANTAAGNENNYNIELDDQSATVVNTAPHDTNDGNVAPPYENLVRPSTAGALASFTGKQAQGDWTLRLCDEFPTADNGQFQNATLYFSNQNDADLSVDITASNNAPTINGGVTLTVTLTNDGPQDAANPAISIPLPTGLSLESASGNGSYDTLTGLWTPTTPLANGGNVALTLVTTVQPTGLYTVTAELTNSGNPDSDSIPNNGDASEDDQDSVTLTPVPPTTPPPLSCPAADQITQTWTSPGTTNGWDAGDLTNSYLMGSIPIDLELTGNTNRLIPRNGIQTPVTATEFTGGNPAGDFSVATYVDFANTSEFVQFEIDLGTPGTGVAELQFDIYDVDLGVWTDRVQITGFLGGNTVAAILTPGSGNSVSGDTITGTSGSTSTQNNGNANVTFLSAVDRVELRYDNASATANPEPQVFSMFANLIACPPLTADISAVKSVEVFDPTGLGLYAVPGQDMLYKITVENGTAATAAANDIVIQDTLPDTVSFVSASLTGFTGGAFGGPALPPASTDCAASACVINFEGGTLDINTTGEIIIVARIK